jgi:Ni/Co efflux regulator RcnB
MKVTTIVAAVTALSFSLGNVAFAQDNNDRERSHRPEPQAHAAAPQRAAPPPAARYRTGPPDRHVGDARGAGPEHNFYRGGRLPSQYRSNQYVVDDWRGHHLNAPPRGYHWVQTGGDYVLVAIATGVIASILLNQ